MHPIIFAHGMEGSPDGTKATMLKARFGARCPNLRTLDLLGQIAKLNKELEEPSVLVGSSLGGLAALGTACKNPESVVHLVLLAPAVGMERLAAQHPQVETQRPGLFGQAREVGSSSVPKQVPTEVIHGLHDEIIRTADVVSLVERSPSAHLLLVHDDHSLAGSLELISRLVESVAKESPLLPIATVI